MSSCLSGSGRSYGFDLDIVKPSSSSSTTTSARSFHSSSPSSTLSESSNSPPRTISIKKARAPRKRPNQMYDEAAALLSTIYPNIFSAKSLRSKPLSKKAAAAFDSFQEDPELLPPLPVIGDAAFLIRPPPPTTEQPAFRIKLKVASPFDTSSPSNESSLDSPCSPVFLLDDDDDFDAESILDEEVGEGIDSIMGNLAADSSGADCNDDEESGGRRVRINPYLRSLIGSRTGGRYDFGSRLRHDRSMQKALRRTDEGEWWRTPAVPVPMGEILPQFKQPLPQLPQPTLSSSEKKSKNKNKKKKKVEKNKAEDATTTTNAAAVSAPEEISKGGLGLKLSHEDVLKAWSGRSMFSDGPDPPESSAVAMARLKDIDLSPDGGGVAVREASVLRYKEKRRSRLFSKKIRYQVRKANADRRPRMKASSGRFVSCPSLLQQAMEAESSQ